MRISTIVFLGFSVGCAPTETQILTQDPEDTSSVETLPQPWYATHFGDLSPVESPLQLCSALNGDHAQVTDFRCDSGDGAPSLSISAWVTTGTCDGEGLSLPTPLRPLMLVVEGEGPATCRLYINGQEVRTLEVLAPEGGLS